MTEMLWYIAVMASVLLSEERGDIGEVVEVVSGTRGIPHMDDGKICPCIGQSHRIEGAEVLERIAREEIKAEIRTGGDLGWELTYGNRECVTGA